MGSMRVRPTSTGRCSTSRRTGCSGFTRNFEDSRVRDDGFTAAWQRGQAPSQTNQPAATEGAYRGSDDPLRSEPLSQRRAPPLAPSTVYIGCPAPADTFMLPYDSHKGTTYFEPSLSHLKFILRPLNIETEIL